MDYVLFGMGYGASLMLLGWALRTFGPQFKYRNPPAEENAEYQVEQRFWVRFIQGLGGVLAIAGTAMVLLTFVVVLVNPSDSTGRNLALAIWTIVLLAVLVWCWFYISKYGLTGIWSRSDGYGFRGTQPSTALPTSTTRVVTSRRLTPGQTEAEEIGSPEVVNDDLMADSMPENPDVDSSDPDLEAESDETEEERVSGPVYDFGDGTETTVPSESSGRAEALRRLRERQERLRKTMQQ